MVLNDRKQSFNMRVLICALAYWAVAKGTTEDARIIRQFEDSNNLFNAKMLDVVVHESPDKNVVVSGFSVMQPLAQLSLAAEEKAHTELLHAIGMQEDGITKIVFPIVYSRFDTVHGVLLKTASKIYIPANRHLQKEFKDDMKRLFNSEVQNLDFTQNFEAATEINKWVEEHTDNKIKTMIQPSVLAPDTVIVLVSAVYFKGTWKVAFEKSNTVYRDFYTNNTYFYKVRTMFKTDELKYGERSELDAQLLEMPFKGDETSLLVVLPRSTNGLPNLLQGLSNPASLPKAINDMYLARVDVFLPRLKIETQTNLKKVLQKVIIGLPRPFWHVCYTFQWLTQIFKSIDSGLKNMWHEDSCCAFVSDAVQKAFIVVREEGAEAGAANAFIQTKMQAINKIFRANHPFVFFLKFGPTTILNGVFMGYGENYISRHGKMRKERKDDKIVRISFDVEPFDPTVSRDKVHKHVTYLIE